MIRPKILSDEVNRIADFVFELDTLTGIETNERDHLKTAVIEGMKAQNDYCYKEMLGQIISSLNMRNVGGVEPEWAMSNKQYQALQGLEG